jgi:hypothetical protein
MRTNLTKRSSIFALLAAFLWLLTACEAIQPAAVGPVGTPTALTAPPAAAVQVTPVPESAGAPPAPDAETAGLANVDTALVSASVLLDHTWQNIDGEVTGNVNDFLVDLSTGAILYVTVEYGGILNLGATGLPVPLRAFLWGADNSLVLNIPEEQLDHFPDLGTDWPNLAAPGWDDALATFWRNAGIDPGYDVTAETGRVTWGSTLIGSNVGDLGLSTTMVDNLLLDIGEGRVRYYVINYTRTEELGDLVVVPFEVMDMHAVLGYLYLTEGYDETMLLAAPIIPREALAGNKLYVVGFAEQLEQHWQEQNLGSPGG